MKWGIIIALGTVHTTTTAGGVCLYKNQWLKMSEHKQEEAGSKASHLDNLKVNVIWLRNPTNIRQPVGSLARESWVIFTARGNSGQ